jgi:hypothetical protein
MEFRKTYALVNTKEGKELEIGSHPNANAAIEAIKANKQWGPLIRFVPMNGSTGTFTLYGRGIWELIEYQIKEVGGKYVCTERLVLVRNEVTRYAPMPDVEKVTILKSYFNAPKK